MKPPGARRQALLARDRARLDGNRLWRLDTPDGPVLQKYYVEKGGRLRNRWRGGWSRILRGATGSTAETRCRVEGEMLALWREAGVDVPRDLTAAYSRYAGERVRVLEWIEGRPLTEVLAGGGLDGAARGALLRRVGEVWGRRLAGAVGRNDARLVQFHGGFMHLLVAGERLVAIDLEQAYLPGRSAAPRAAREVASCLRGLARGREGAGLREDLEALVSGFPDRGVLEAAVEEALAPRGGWGLVRALDPRGGRRAGPLRALRELLRGGGGGA